MEDIYYLGPALDGETKEQKCQRLLLDADPKLISIDTETVSLNNRSPIGVGIAVSPYDAFYFPTFPVVSPLLPTRLLEDPSVTKVFHNAPFDLDVLDVLSIQMNMEFDYHNVRDTTVMAHLLMYEDARLKWLMAEVGRSQHPDASELLKQYNAKIMTELPQAVVAEHCLLDCTGTMALYKKWIEDIDMPYFLTEMALIPILLKMSKRGIKIDHAVRAELDRDTTTQMEFFRSIAEEEGFNPASPQQVAYILAKRGNFLPFTKSRKSLSTDESVLEMLDDPMAQVVLNFRHANKLLGTYIKPLEGEDRIYTHFHLDAVTGRISSTKRNLQNVPVDARAMCLPDSDVLSGFDYVQIELITLAYLSKDLDMRMIYDKLEYGDKEGGDIHLQTAQFMNIPRKIAKNVNFAMIYGATPQTVRETAKIKDIRKCEQLVHDWFAKYRSAGEWIKAQQELGRRQGYVTTIYGRNIRLPMDMSPDAVDRRSINYCIQGSAAEIIKRAMIKCAHLPMVLQIHDELLFDGRVELPEGLDNIAPYRTPIEIKEIERWQ